MNRTLLTSLITLVLLGGIVVQQFWLPQPADAEPYHAAIQRIIAELPEPGAEWRAEEVELPPAAVSLLRPKATISMRYKRLATGSDVSFILIQCGDARDMAGHYPPICYPNSGWTLKQAKSMSWHADEQQVPGMEYSFERVSSGRMLRLTVANLILLPDASFAMNMNDLNSLETDYRHRFFGAAQVQFVFDHQVSAGERTLMIEQLLKRYEPVIRAIRSGVRYE